MSTPSPSPTPACRTGRHRADARSPRTARAGRRQMTLAMHGTGHRTVRVGYVVAMPLWKASYRLSLPADPAAATARLQGWAVLENFSGQDWNDVDLTLLSGNPVTFRQALYESYYVPRPVVPVEAGRAGVAAGGHRRSWRARGAEADAASTPTSRAAAPPAMAGDRRRANRRGAPSGPGAGTIGGRGGSRGRDANRLYPARQGQRRGRAEPGPAAARPRRCRRTASTSISRRSTPAHPLAAIELTNAADTGLPPGVLTIYQRRRAHGAALSRRCAARRAAGRRQAPAGVCGRRQGDGGLQRLRDAAHRQGDDRRRRCCG